MSVDDDGDVEVGGELSWLFTSKFDMLLIVEVVGDEEGPSEPLLFWLPLA